MLDNVLFTTNAEYVHVQLFRFREKYGEKHVKFTRRRESFARGTRDVAQRTFQRVSSSASAAAAAAVEVFSSANTMQTGKFSCFHDIAIFANRHESC